MEAQRQINGHLLENLMERHPKLSNCKDEIYSACLLLAKCFSEKGKLLVAGNGGSAADSEHITGELMKSFVLPRPLEPEFQKALTDTDAEFGGILKDRLQRALPTMSLDGQPALTTAYINDCDPLLCYAQQINGYGRKGDVFLAITTSGNSKNLLYAAVTAKALGMKVMGLTGETGGKLKKYCDVCITVPETETYKVQELHLPVYHAICLIVEDYFWGKG